MKIPADEIARLNSLFPKELSSETLAKIKRLKDQTEGEKGPLIMQLPAKVMVDGQEKPFTILTMQAIMLKASKADNNLKSLYISDYIPIETKNQVWDSHLGIWTSACLKGSDNKNYGNQLKHQIEILGIEYKIEADMILGMALRDISEQKQVMIDKDFMRLNTRDSNDDPLEVSINCHNRSFQLNVSSDDDNYAYSNCGIGASFRIFS